MCVVFVVGIHRRVGDLIRTTGVADGDDLFADLYFGVVASSLEAKSLASTFNSATSPCDTGRKSTTLAGWDCGLTPAAPPLRTVKVCSIGAYYVALDIFQFAHPVLKELVGVDRRILPGVLLHDRVDDFAPRCPPRQDPRSGRP